MARRLGIQFEGALYHIINRGNYRSDVFASVGATQAFEATLFEACERHGWILHAHVVMRNRFHPVLETPRANLVEGMHWLTLWLAFRIISASQYPQPSRAPFLLLPRSPYFG